MRRLKIDMCHPNYLCMGHTHVFIDFNEKNLELIPRIKPHISRVKIHVFITDRERIDETLKLILRLGGKRLKQEDKYKSKIIVHLPSQLKDLHNRIKKFFEFLGDDPRYKIYTYKKRKSISFISRRSFSPHYICILFLDKYLAVEVGNMDSRMLCPRIIFPEYPYEPKEEPRKGGIFSSEEEMLNPNQFKDKLIAAFKEQCPEGILKSFKDDDEIWDYIMAQGEWKIGGTY